MAVRTADAGEPTAGVAAVEVALHDFFDDRAEETVLLLEAILILSQEPDEVMEQNPLEDRPLGITRTIHSRHGGRKASKNGPTSPIKPDLPKKKRMSGSNGRFWAGKRQPALTLDPENRNGPRQSKT
jgi:hypothetical protein